MLTTRKLLGNYQETFRKLFGNFKDQGGTRNMGFKNPEIFKCLGRGSSCFEGIFIFNFGQNISTVSCRKTWKGKACLGDSEGLRALGARKVAGKLEKGKLVSGTLKACEPWGHGKLQRVLERDSCEPWGHRMLYNSCEPWGHAAELVIESCREHKKLRALRARHAVQKNLLLWTLLNL